jgi:hypothetical protein
MVKMPRCGSLRFNFSLQSLFACITLVALATVWLTSQLQAAKTRRELVARAMAVDPFRVRGTLECGACCGEDLFGNANVTGIELSSAHFTRSDLAQYRAAFPQTRIDYFAP